MSRSRNTAASSAWPARSRPNADYRDRVREALVKAIGKEATDAKVAAFLELVSYRPLDATSNEGWDDFAELMGAVKDHVRVFYLSTSPRIFVDICERLRKHGLNGEGSRVVIEKPIGHDLASAREINDAVGAVFEENQIFRIDHYLGKETVQNLLALRFANALFEPLWNAAHIDHVQITVAETVGVEQRGAYYDNAGALRDMVQNHLMQLLCLVAMEPPAIAGPGRGARREAQGAACAAADRRRQCRAADRARPVPCRRRQRRCRPGLPGGPGQADSSTPRPSSR